MNNDGLGQLTRAQLARLGREYMAAGQFIGRTGYAALRMRHGDESYRDVAIDNWMYASPVYTQRMQRAMGFAGNDVPTIFKGLQLEVGFAHQYFDVHFEVETPEKGRFWLASCGPLLEMEPRGEQAVKTMCHDIEDPTFDATAVATNPRARVRPVHRPPRVPSDRTPHCEWNVFIDHEAEPLTERAGTRRMRETCLAKLDIARPLSRETGGIDYYDGAVFEVLQLERLSHAALVVVCKELAVQIHLLVNSLMLSIDQRYGRESADAVAEFQMTGSSWVISERLCHWLGGEKQGIDRVVDAVAVHPAFQPAEYIELNIEKTGESTARLRFSSSPAGDELEGYGWFGLLKSGNTEGLEALLRGIDAKATLRPVAGEGLTWDIAIDASVSAGEEPLAVQIAKGTVLYQTQFENHIPLLQTV
jgi:hypothetical protein